MEKINNTIENIKKMIKTRKVSKKEKIKQLKTYDPELYYKILFYSLFLNFPDKISNYYFHFNENPTFYKIADDYVNRRINLDSKTKSLLIKNFSLFQKIIQDEIVEKETLYPKIYPIIGFETQILFKKNIGDGIFYIPYPALIGITGFNGIGKSHFAMFLLHNINLKKNEKLYIINEDNVIVRKLDLEKINFDIIRTFEFNSALLSYISKYKVIVFDTFSSFFTATETSIMDKALKELYFISSQKTIFLINHQLKTIKTNKNENTQASIYTTYGAFYTNYLDIGITMNKKFVYKRGKKLQALEIKVEKDRYNLMQDKTFDIIDIDETIKTNEFMKEILKTEEEIKEEEWEDILEEEDEFEDEFVEIEEEY